MPIADPPPSDRVPGHDGDSRHEQTRGQDRDSRPEVPPHRDAARGPRRDLDGIAAVLRAAGCVFAEEEARILLEAADEAAALDALVARRVAGEPLEVIVGWAEFRGRRVAVAPGVFVPRRRSAILVDLALETGALRDERSDATVLDLCCGSGAVGAAIAEARPRARIVAADIDERATAVARRTLGPDAIVVTGDLFAALPPELRGRIDVIVANAPYVPTDEIEFMPQDARLHEPVATLDGGPTGTELQARVARGSAGWLAPGGTLIVETSLHQSETTAAHLAAAGFSTRTARDDELDGTAVVGTRRAGGPERTGQDRTEQEHTGQEHAGQE